MPKLALDIGSGPYPCINDKFEWTHMDPYPYPHVEIIGSGTAIPFPDSYFDYVRNSCVIEHIESKDHILFLSEMKRVLKQDGVIETVVSDMDTLITNYKRFNLPQDRIETEVNKIIHGTAGVGMQHACLCGVTDVLTLCKVVDLEVVGIDRLTRLPRDVIIRSRKKGYSHGDESLVSIIITCRNYAGYVAEAIESTINQRYSNMEIVVVDDASNDNSIEIIERYPVKLIKHSHNLGLPFARNSGIREAKGEFIITLDADDQLHHEYTRLCVDGYNQFKENNLGIVRTGLVTFTEDGKMQEGPPLPLIGLSDQLISNRIFVSAMFPRKVWEEVGGYSEDMNDGFEDWEFWVKIMERGYNVLTVDRCLLMYRIHEKSKGRSRSSERTLVSRQRLFYKHRDTYKKLFVEKLPGWEEASV